MGASITETHCHLDYLKSDEIKEVIKKAKSNGVNRFITVAVSTDNQNRVIEIANEFQEVFTTQGIHPHYAKDVVDDDFLLMKKNIKNKKVIAIGEIGLDYHYEHSKRKTQIEIFEKQMQLAIDNQ